MKNIYLKFYVAEKQRHNGALLYEWLLEEAKKMGAPGGSAFRSIAGFGRHGRMHELDLHRKLAGQFEKCFLVHPAMPAETRNGTEC